MTTARPRLTEAEYDALLTTEAPCPFADGTEQQIEGFALYEHVRSLINATIRSGFRNSPTRSMITMRLALLEACNELNAKRYEGFLSRMPSFALYSSVLDEYEASLGTTPPPTPPHPRRSTTPPPPAPADRVEDVDDDDFDDDPLLEPAPSAPTSARTPAARFTPPATAPTGGTTNEDIMAVLMGITPVLDNHAKHIDDLDNDVDVLWDDYMRRNQKPSFWQKLFGTRRRGH